MKSKKIGTISLNINTKDFNYGALLHSYAFQKYLEKNNLCDKTEIIDYITKTNENYDRNNPIKMAIKKRKIKAIIKSIIIYIPYKIKLKKFKKFIKNNMKVSDKQYTQQKLNDANLDYDTVICESDVIWSPGFFGGKFDKSFFMDLDSMKNVKKIAYAPSMADNNLTDQQKSDLKELIKDIDYISCRESYEKVELMKLTDKPVEHVLDPVLLLKEDDYSDIIGKRIIKQPYILLYLPVNDNKKLRAYAKEYAKKNNLKILEISNDCMKKWNGKTLIDAGIEEFLSAIKYSDVLFTNSFHGICFALIFKKQFYAFSRKNFGKVKDICDCMDLNDRFFEHDDFVQLPYIDYIKINEKIDSMRKKSEEWLKNALEI